MRLSVSLREQLLRSNITKTEILHLAFVRRPGEVSPFLAGIFFLFAYIPK